MTQAWTDTSNHKTRDKDVKFKSSPNDEYAFAIVMVGDRKSI